MGGVGVGGGGQGSRDWRGPETGLAGGRLRSQATKTSWADTLTVLNRLKKRGIWLNSGRDKGGWGGGGTGRGRGGGQGSRDWSGW